jgi:membrane fusion protein, multidrug efflux system
MKHTRSVTGVQFAFVLAFALTAAACSNSSVASNSADPSSNPPASHVSVAQPASDSLAHLPAAPEILSVLSVEHQVDLSTESDGTIMSISKDEGSLVRVGDILGQLDDRILKLEFIKAQDDLKVAQNNVKYKESELRAKSAAFDRQRLLRQMGLSSQADLEAADFGAKAAEYDLHGWEAQAEASQAEMSRINLLIDKTRLRAPFSGVVARRYVREGQTVAKGDRCFRISQLSPLLVQFQVPESAGHRPEIGNPVTVVVLEDPNLPLAARISKISPTVDPASDSYNVTAQLKDSSSSYLRPGMAVRVVWPPSGSSTAR